MHNFQNKIVSKDKNRCDVSLELFGQLIPGNSLDSGCISVLSVQLIPYCLYNISVRHFECEEGSDQILQYILKRLFSLLVGLFLYVVLFKHRLHISCFAWFYSN